jgi:mannitol/fructose-specific phosphotransferase system IIA component (Ntr-type)
MHLHILSRLAVMAHATEFLQILDEATDPEQVIEIVRAAEEGFLK